MNRIFPTELKPGDHVIDDNNRDYTVAKNQPACSDKPRQAFITTEDGELIEYVVSQKVTLCNN